MNSVKRGLERIRHELKFRICEVTDVQYITPQMIRVIVTSPELEGFASLAYDDHVKLFFAPDGAELAMPVASVRGLQFPDHLPQPQGRDYTPRHFDAATNSLTLDFVVHGQGPACSWAMAAMPGDKLGVGGPRGSFVLRGGFDWYVLVGDETALPAIARRLEELPVGSKVIALIEIANADERQTLSSKADMDVRWLQRNGAKAGETDLLLNAVLELALPPGDGYIFVAGEAAMSKCVRQYFVDKRNHNPEWIKAAGYWQSGSADFDDGHEH